MRSTHEVLDALGDPKPEAAAAFSETINETLTELTIQERIFYLLLYANKHYNYLDDPDFDLVDYRLAAESVEPFGPDHTEAAHVENITVEKVARCGGCEKVYGREDAREGYWADDNKWVEYETERCPYCGTEVDHGQTEVKSVGF